MSAKVLVLGGRSRSQAVWCIARGFERIGCAVRYQPTRRAGTARDPLLNARDVLGAIVREMKPDVLFWTMCKQDCPEGLITHLRALMPAMATVFHCFDDPFQIDENACPPCVREFQYAATCCEGSVPWYAAKGVRAITVYPPCDPDLHGRAKPTAKESCDFSFAATHVYPREKYAAVLVPRRDMAREAAKLGRLHLYGHWQQRRYDWGGIYGAPELEKCYRGYRLYEDMPGIFAASSINLCSHVRPDGWHYLNERVITVTGSGGFLLTDHVNGIEDLYVPDRDIVTFKGLDEFREKAEYWLRHPLERAAVAARGRQVALDRFSNEQHARAVLTLCGVEP